MNDEFGTGRQAPGSLVFRRQADRAGRRGAGHGMQGWLASPRQRGVLGAAVAGFMLLGVEQASGASKSEGIGQLSITRGTLGGNVSRLPSSLSTALVSTSRNISSLSSSLSTTSRVIASLSTSTSTRIGKLESGLDEMSSTAQFQTRRIDGVVKRIDRADAQFGELHRQTASLEQAYAKAKSTAQVQAKQIDDVSRRTDRADAQLGELHRQTASLEQADAKAKSTAQAQAKQIDDVSRRTDRADAQLGELHRQTASLEQADAKAKSTAQAQAKQIDDVSKRTDRADAQLGELNRQTASLEQADAEAKATAQAQAKRIDGVSERIDKGEVQFDELNRQMAPLARASDEARRNDSFIAPTLSGGGSGPMVESSGPGADHTGRSRIDPAGCTLANGFDATATGLCAAAGTIAGRDGARESRRADGATAYGAYARAREHHATALGFRALAARDGAVAIGYQAGALGAQATALGDGARADGDRSVALGASALATGRGAVALGAGSIADRDATVSIGSPGRERRLVNLAPGVAPGDAVNLSQLATLGRSLEDVARRAYTGVAMSMAMSGLYLPSLNPGEVAAGVGVGGFSGYRAIALNLKGLAGNGRLGWGAGVSTTGRLTGFNLGAGWKW
ncbi:YadA-like family protein [Burkholderia gladioli]|uniref:YadA-like family protein n=1 Tax=Burkholderia gladioli TaxID=28095 RepID=UPI00264FA5B4|nr:YadA-like family protein [Burkholderia gladioli]MDN7715020.1 YadA-like family protein [Burkholderia gladioli]